MSASLPSARISSLSPDQQSRLYGVVAAARAIYDERHAAGDKRYARHDACQCRTAKPKEDA
jgi:hypothetical protein